MGGTRSKPQGTAKTDNVENPPTNSQAEIHNFDQPEQRPPGITLLTVDAWRYLGRYLNLNHLMRIQGANNVFHKLIWGDVVNSLSFSRVVDLPAVLQSLAKKSPKLLQLNLQRHDGVTGKELSHISGLTKLRLLNLKYCSKLTDANLVYIQPLTNLTCLNLFFCDKLSSEGFSRHLTSLTNLESLNLKYCEISSLDPIQGMTKLRRLNLFYVERIHNFEPLQSLTLLEKLDLTKNPNITSPASLEPFRPLTGLKELKLGSSKTERLTPLTKLAQLNILRIEDCPSIGDEALYKDIACMTNLRSLSLITISNQLTSAGLHGLTSLEKLTHLSLAGNALPADAWKALVRLPKIQKMNLYEGGANPHRNGAQVLKFFQDMGNKNIIVEF